MNGIDVSFAQGNIDWRQVKTSGKADFTISPEFVPYAPSNRELYEMILALQSGT